MDAKWADDENAKGEKHRKYDGCMDAGRVVEGTVYRDVILRENIIMVDVATNQNTERDGHGVGVSPINDMPAVLNRKLRDMHTLGPDTIVQRFFKVLRYRFFCVHVPSGGTPEGRN